MSSERTTSQCFFRQNKYFRMLFPKSSNFSSSLWNNFESSLTERMKKLIPENKDEILTLPWMIIAMELLYDTHNDINILITDLKLHDVTDCSDVYMDITIKFMDLCNAISSLLGCIDHCILCFKVLWHKLEMKFEEEQCTKICSTLDSWRKDITAEILKYRTVLGRYVESLNFYKVKNFKKAKVLMKAFYAANVLTAYICSVFVTVLSNSDKDVSPINISKQSLWEKDFLNLQTIVNVKIKDLVSSDGTTTVIKELERVAAKVTKKICRTVQDGDDVLVQESAEESNGEGKEEIEKLDHELDELSKKVRNLFSITLKGRETICACLLSELPHA
ncbi:protein BPS1, chloroplastic [Capsella rubella]|uniref:protein BPS1, chloroplastic n=1 Tax=Capsella rubella TaxID=81985 RepID=UPI000CD58953|nr:protein BPS1, chloroplastic [Capsella rubella]